MTYKVTVTYCNHGFDRPVERGYVEGLKVNYPTIDAFFYLFINICWIFE